jgi:hypothetical protein
MVAEPVAIASTIPEALTTATPESLEVQVITGTCSPAGETIAFNFTEPPTSSSTVVWFKVSEYSTGCTGSSQLTNARATHAKNAKNKFFFITLKLVVNK